MFKLSCPDWLVPTFLYGLQLVCTAVLGLLFFVLFQDVLFFVIGHSRWEEGIAAIFSWGVVYEIVRRIKSLFWVTILTLTAMGALRLEDLLSPLSPRNNVAQPIK